MPTGQEILWFAPLLLALALLQALCTVQLRNIFLLPVAYTRKIFHVLVFCTAAILQSQASFSWLCIYGAWVSALVWLAIFKGDGHPFYECLARPQDAPYRRRYVILPWLATLMGGLSSQLFFGAFSVAGFWVVGLADAAAEPVGCAWGKHPYSLAWVPWLKTSRRTWEGSLTVALCSLGIFWCLGLASWPSLIMGAIWMTLIEAFSPHGLDNLTLQLGASFFLWACY